MKDIPARNTSEDKFRVRRIIASWILAFALWANNIPWLLMLAAWTHDHWLHQVPEMSVRTAAVISGLLILLAEFAIVIVAVYARIRRSPWAGG